MRGLLAVGVAAAVVVAVPLSARGDGGASAVAAPRAWSSLSDPPAGPSTRPTGSLLFPDSDMPTPAAASGPLAARDLPAPAELGGQWRPFADPGGHEAGFAGNGTWTRARDVNRVLQEIAPLGCPRAVPAGGGSPPRHALEGTYRQVSGDGAAVALVLEWADEEGAAAFMRRHGAAVAACAAPKRSLPADAPLRLAVETQVVSDVRIVDVRRELGTGASPVVWTEVVVRAGPRVALLIVGVPAGDRAPEVGRLTQAVVTGLGR